MTPALATRKVPWSTGKSGTPIASVDSRPSPGMEKTVSIVIAPRDHEPDVERDHRRRRQQRVADGVPVAHDDVAQALGPRRLQVVLTQLVEQRAAHDQGVLRQVGERQRGHRQDQVPGGVEDAVQRRPGRRPASAARRSGRCPGTNPKPTPSPAISIRPSHHSGIE